MAKSRKGLALEKRSWEKRSQAGGDVSKETRRSEDRLHDGNALTTDVSRDWATGSRRNVNPWSGLDSQAAGDFSPIGALLRSRWELPDRKGTSRAGIKDG
jgi:hypothetical protein